MFTAMLTVFKLGLWESKFLGKNRRLESATECYAPIAWWELFLQNILPNICAPRQENWQHWNAKALCPSCGAVGLISCISPPGHHSETLDTSLSLSCTDLWGSKHLLDMFCSELMWSIKKIAKKKKSWEELSCSLQSLQAIRAWLK